MGAGKVWAKPAMQSAPPNVCAQYGIVAANCKATTYYHFGSQRVAMREQTDGNPTGAVYWLHGDHLGSASLTTDAGGGRFAELRYKPWGEVRWSSGAMPTDRRFTGMTTHAGLGGLVTMGVREYLPSLGRWLSADTIVPRPGDPQAFNRFSYVRNSPLGRIDPSGHCDGNVGGSQSCSDTYETPIQTLAKYAARMRDAVSNGADPVEAFASISDHAMILFYGVIDDYMWAMTNVILGVDPRQKSPSVCGAFSGMGCTKSEYFVGSLLPYNHSPDDGASEVGDWNPDFFDGTNNQAFHFWYAVASAY